MSATKKQTRGKPLVWKATFNQNDPLRIENDELLLWAEGRIEAKEKAQLIIRKFALLKFEHELDEHLRVATIKVELAGIEP